MDTSDPLCGAMEDVDEAGVFPLESIDGDTDDPRDDAVSELAEFRPESVFTPVSMR